MRDFEHVAQGRFSGLNPLLIEDSQKCLPILPKGKAGAIFHLLAMGRLKERRHSASCNCQSQSAYCWIGLAMSSSNPKYKGRLLICGGILLLENMGLDNSPLGWTIPHSYGRGMYVSEHSGPRQPRFALNSNFGWSRLYGKQTYPIGIFQFFPDDQFILRPVLRCSHT